MAKDPAFLFYYVDFQHGTRKMTFAEKGAYIELLCEQADSGHLSLDDIKRILREDFPIWESICYKFIKDEDGCFYNGRLEERLNERKNYVLSRKSNLMGGHKKPHMGKHMENRNRNRIENEDGINKFNPPKAVEVLEYCRKNGYTIDPYKFVNHYEANGWYRGKTKIRDWKACVRTWQSREKNEKLLDKDSENNPEKKKVSAMISQTVKNMK